MEHAEVVQDLMRLEALETAHRQNGMRYGGQIVQKEQSNARSHEIIAELTSALPKITDAGFIAHDGREAKNATQGSHFITERLLSHRQELNQGQYDALPMGSVAGQEIVAAGNQHQWRVFLADTPSIPVTIQPSTEAITTTNWVLRLSNALQRAEETIEKRQTEIQIREREIQELRELLGQEGFEQAEDLANVRARLAEIDSQLGMESELDVVDVDSECLWANDLGVFGDSYVNKLLPSDLRVGDKVSHATLGNAVVIEAPTDSGESRLWLKPEAGDAQVAYGSVNLIGRLAATMTEFEVAVLSATERDKVTGWHDLRDGETFVFEVAGKTHTAIKKEGHGGERSPQFEVIKGPTDITTRGERIVGAGMTVIVKDRLTQEQVESRKILAALPHINQLISGETVTAVYDKDGHRSELQPPILIPDARQSYQTLREVTEGDWGHKFVTTPPEYAELETIHDVPLTELRSGDRVRRADIDKSVQTRDEIVTVVKPGWEAQGITTQYRRDGHGGVIKGRQSRKARCSVLQRTIANLTIAERVDAGLLNLPAGCEPTTLDKMNLGELFIRDASGAPTVMRLTAKDAGARNIGWRYATAVAAATGERTQVGMTEDVFSVDDRIVTIEQVNALCVPGSRQAGAWPAENAGMSPGAQTLPAQTHHLRAPGL